ncbi:hypothetical protein GE09DRAFT_1079151 [Coniochaeta sp. 2T2.1]|nr:hypothetical protein GE09DRAFT_1079151 [Coniochaeta sp. 2T2.1]
MSLARGLSLALMPVGIAATYALTISRRAPTTWWSRPTRTRIGGANCLVSDDFTSQFSTSSLKLERAELRAVR